LAALGSRLIVIVNCDCPPALIVKFSAHGARRRKSRREKRASLALETYIYSLMHFCQLPLFFASLRCNICKIFQRYIHTLWTIAIILMGHKLTFDFSEHEKFKRSLVSVSFFSFISVFV